MKLTAYVRPGYQLTIRPAPVERDWMDSTCDRFAYRCLPLDIANSHGWEILCPSPFTAAWSGNNGVDSVQVNSDAHPAIALSHFGFGIMTIAMPCVFVTEPQIDLFVQGPMNRFKDAIAAMSAIVETDWLSYTFTMNWKFTRANVSVKFEEGEPLCHIFPIQRGLLESVEPEIRNLGSNGELEKRNKVWGASREAFKEELRNGPARPATESWQKHYFLGREPDGSPCAARNHRTKLLLKPFVSRLDGSQ